MFDDFIVNHREAGSTREKKGTIFRKDNYSSIIFCTRCYIILCKLSKATFTNKKGFPIPSNLMKLSCFRKKCLKRKTF